MSNSSKYNQWPATASIVSMTTTYISGLIWPTILPLRLQCSRCIAELLYARQWNAWFSINYLIYHPDMHWLSAQNSSPHSYWVHHSDATAWLLGHANSPDTIFFSDPITQMTPTTLVETVSIDPIHVTAFWFRVISWKVALYWTNTVLGGSLRLDTYPNPA